MKFITPKLIKIFKILFIIVCVLFISGYLLYTYQPKTYLKIKKVLIKTFSEKKDLQTITDTHAIFATQTYPIRSRTVFKLIYQKPTQEDSPITITLQRDPEGNFVRLARLPILDNFQWLKINDQKYTILQKAESPYLYNSTTDFFAAPPNNDKVLLTEDIELETFKDSNYLGEESTLENLQAIDYIIFNYFETYQENGLEVYETVIDATNAYVKDNNVFWQITMPKVSVENPIALKIDINFAQPNYIINN